MQRHLTAVHSRKAGFTLVELLIVIAIIAVLAAIAIPQFTKYRNRAYISEIESDSRNAFTASQVYLTDHPEENIDSENKLTDVGLRLSPNISWVSGNMGINAGNVKLSSTKAVGTKDDALIHFNGKIELN